MVNNKISLKVIERRSLTDRVDSLRLSLVAPNDFHFIPGQFVSVLVPKGDEVFRRSYSLINKPGEDIEFLYTYFPGGVASEYFRSLKLGDVINAMGPLGRLTIQEPILGRCFAIATGTGIGPFISILKSMDFSQTELNIIFGCRTPEESLCKNFNQDFSIEHDNFNLWHCYSRHDGDIDHRSFQGYVQEKLKGFDFDPVLDKFYLCGHPDMVEDVNKYLIAVGINNKNIIKEKYIVSGLSK